MKFRKLAAFVAALRLSLGLALVASGARAQSNALPFSVVPTPEPPISITTPISPPYDPMAKIEQEDQQEEDQFMMQSIQADQMRRLQDSIAANTAALRELHDGQ